MTTRLIINADDYGFSSEVSSGIRYANLNGIVTSTTCMMNTPNVSSDIKIALRETPNLGLGIQLVLTTGKPVLPIANIPGLVDLDGNFLKQNEFINQAGLIDNSEIKREWRAQIDAFIAIAHKNPTHLATSKHLALLTPNILIIFLELALEYQLPIRLPIAHGKLPSDSDFSDELEGSIADFAPKILNEFQPRSPDAFFPSFNNKQATRAEIIRILMLLLPNGCFEIMCHPGFSDEPHLINQGQKEIEILTDNQIRKELGKRDIELINFAQL